MKRIMSRLTYANVASSLALFLVLSGGVAVAANSLAKNSVGSKQIKRNAVTSVKIKKDAVTSAKIRSGAVTSAKIQAGAVTADKLSGTFGASKLGPIVARTASGVVPRDLDVGAVSASCRPGETLLSGGANWTYTGPDQFAYLGDSYRVNATTWRAIGFVSSDFPSNPANLTLNVTVLCLGG